MLPLFFGLFRPIPDRFHARVMKMTNRFQAGGGRWVLLIVPVGVLAWYLWFREGPPPVRAPDPLQELLRRLESDNAEERMRAAEEVAQTPVRERRGEFRKLLRCMVRDDPGIEAAKKALALLDVPESKDELVQRVKGNGPGRADTLTELADRFGGEADVRTLLESLQTDSTLGAPAKAALQVLHPQPRVVLQGHNGRVLVAAISPDGKTLASGDEDGTLRLWDLETSKLRTTLYGHSGGITALAFSPDGKQLVSGGAVLDRKKYWPDSVAADIFIWDPGTGKMTGAEPGFARAVYCLAFSRDGTKLAAGCFSLNEKDFEVHLWEAERLRNRTSFPVEERSIRGLVFGPDAGRLWTWGGSNYNDIVKEWDLAGVAKRRDFPTPPWCQEIVFAPDGKSYFASGYQQKDDQSFLEGRDVEAGTIQLRIPVSSAEIETLAICPDGKLLAIGTRIRTDAASRRGDITLWDLGIGKVRGTIPAHTGMMTGLAFHPDGKRLVSWSRERTTIKLWEIQQFGR
jgi:WD domain, G-beta repeat